jgi:hypothetical protein
MGHAHRAGDCLCYNPAVLYWESKRRLKELREFRQLVRSYFSNTGFDSMGRRHENADAREERARINLKIPEVVRSCTLIGHSLTLSYNSPRHGLAGEINVVTNLFNLDRQRIPASKAFDSLDRAIGDYERLETKLRRQSWNPLYWILVAFIALLGLPFRVLGAAGFDARAMERSVIGRLFKFVEGVVIFLAALLQVLSLLGLPTSLSHLIGLLRHR